MGSKKGLHWKVHVGRYTTKHSCYLKRQLEGEGTVGSNVAITECFPTHRVQVPCY